MRQTDKLGGDLYIMLLSVGKEDAFPGNKVWTKLPPLDQNALLIFWAEFNTPSVSTQGTKPLEGQVPNAEESFC